MEGFFDNLAAAATNENAVLSQLTDNNTKLVNTNEKLSVSVKISRVRIDSSSRRSTLYDDGWAETWAVTQRTT